MFPTQRMLDFWLDRAGATPAVGSWHGVPLLREGRWLTNAGKRDLLGFLSTPVGRSTTFDPGALAPPADAIAIYDVPTGGPLHTALMSHESAISVDLYECPVAATGGDFESYLGERFGGRSRRRFRRQLRRLESLGEVSLDWAAPERLEELFERFFSLLTETFAALGEFNRNLLRREYLNALWQQLHDDTFRVSVLSLDGIPVSFRTGFVHGDRFVGYMPISDRAFHKYSLGQLHLFLLLPQLIDEGIHDYDFSKGGTGLKATWANRSYSLSAVVVPLRRSAAARLRVRRLRTVEGLRRRLHESGGARFLRKLRFTYRRRFDRELGRRLAEAERRSRRVRVRRPTASTPLGEAVAFSYRPLRHYPLAARRALLERTYGLRGARLAIADDGAAGQLLTAEGGPVLAWDSD